MKKKGLESAKESVVDPSENFSDELDQTQDLNEENTDIKEADTIKEVPEEDMEENFEEGDESNQIPEEDAPIKKDISEEDNLNNEDEEYGSFDDMEEL